MARLSGSKPIAIMLCGSKSSNSKIDAASNAHLLGLKAASSFSKSLIYSNIVISPPKITCGIRTSGISPIDASDVLTSEEINNPNSKD